MIRVYKFGGASVKDADGVRNVTSIIRKTEQPLITVISAMGKMTNALEELHRSFFEKKQEEALGVYQNVIAYHRNIIKDLFGDGDACMGFNDLARSLKGIISQEPSMHYDYEYDRIVSFGELFSTKIISEYWAADGLANKWVDVRTVLKTDDLYRDANVDWELTPRLIRKAFDGKGLFLTQGFLGGTINNLTTTLGREGSDYTAAIIAYSMDAKEVTIWKDVPGVLNADPRLFPDAVMIKELSYNEAIELAYYGAQVIHPKTLKPLQNKDIILNVKSFLDHDAPGTRICERKGISEQVPVYILKKDQMFVTISPRDFSFIMEDKLIEIISIFRKFRIRMNLMQNSALNFSACFDDNGHSERLMEVLKDNFTVRYNQGVNLLTIRQYTPESIEKMTVDKEIIDSQVTRKVARFVLK
jgi:aspartate kinase